MLFVLGVDNRGTRKKTSRSRVENQQQTQPTYDAGPGIEPRKHLWEGSALTRVRTGRGKPGKSWNFIIAFSRTGKSWKKATGPGKFWKSVKLS